MIHFRYHLISLVAVFLALGIGIVMGSTVIDRAIVDGLENRIERAEKNSIETQTENEALRRQIEQQDSQDTVLAGHSVRSVLPGQTVFVIRIGDVSDNVLTETRELLAVSEAKLGGEILLNEDFLKSNKAELGKSLLERDDVKAIQGVNNSKTKAITYSLIELFAQRAGSTLSTPLSQTDISSLFSNADAFKEQEVASSFDQALPISFIVLVNRTDLENSNTTSFIANLPTIYPMTVGFVGSETDSPSRSKSIEKFSEQLSTWMVLDNAESPSGRAAMLIAHSRAITGERSIYGISSKALSPAPELT